MVVNNGPFDDRNDRAIRQLGLSGHAGQEARPISEHIALYGHVLGHLLLNREMSGIGHLPLLDPRDGYVHVAQSRNCGGCKARATHLTGAF